MKYKLILLSLLFGTTIPAYSSVLIVQHQNDIDAIATADDGTGNPVTDEHMDSSPSLASYGNSVGASIFNDPFFASPFTSLSSTIFSDGVAVAMHADANANSGYPFDNSTLTANASAQSKLVFTVDATGYYRLQVSAIHFEGNALSVYSLSEDGTPLLSDAGGDLTVDATVQLTQGSKIRLDSYAYASASVTQSNAFNAGSENLNVSLRAVPEPNSLLALGIGTGLLLRRATRRRSDSWTRTPYGA